MIAYITWSVHSIWIIYVLFICDGFRVVFLFGQPRYSSMCVRLSAGYLKDTVGVFTKVVHFIFLWLNGFQRMAWFYFYHMSQKERSVVAYNLKFYIVFCCNFGIPVIAINFRSEWFTFAIERRVKILIIYLVVLISLYELLQGSVT